MADYKLIDADNHYYEPEDAFTRHGDEEVKSFVRWVSEGKKKQIMFGIQQPTAIPNPTFNPITKPGAFHGRLKELAEGGLRNLPFGDKRIFGELEPLPDHYRDRSSRLLVMEDQGVERAIFYPTLGVGIEGLNPDRVELTYKCFHAFNLWLEEDWGFAYRDRIYAAPYIPVARPAPGGQGARLPARARRQGRRRCAPARPTAAPPPTPPGTPSGLGSTSRASSSRTTATRRPTTTAACSR